MNSDKIKDKYELGLNSYLYNLPIEYLGGRVESFAQRTGIYKTIDDKLNKINSKINKLNSQYLNNKSNENVNENTNILNEKSNENIDKLNENINENTNKDIDNKNENIDKLNENINNCFIKHGKKYNLKLNELMKLSNIKDIKEFKQILINYELIKDEYLINRTYRLTEEQKQLLIDNFKLIFNHE
jgi:glutamyl/glutaminyl-tRNA synthetase